MNNSIKNYLCRHNHLTETHTNLGSYSPEEKELLEEVFAPNIKLIKDVSSSSENPKFHLSIIYLSIGMVKINSIESVYDYDKNKFFIIVDIDAVISGKKRDVITKLLINTSQIDGLEFFLKHGIKAEVAVVVTNGSKIENENLDKNLSIDNFSISSTDPVDPYPPFAPNP